MQYLSRGASSWMVPWIVKFVWIGFFFGEIGRRKICECQQISLSNSRLCFWNTLFWTNDSTRSEEVKWSGEEQPWSHVTSISPSLQLHLLLRYGDCFDWFTSHSSFLIALVAPEGFWAEFYNLIQLTCCFWFPFLVECIFAFAGRPWCGNIFFVFLTSWSFYLKTFWFDCF